MDGEEIKFGINDMIEKGKHEIKEETNHNGKNNG
jgi:hypothetical protein